MFVSRERCGRHRFLSDAQSRGALAAAADYYAVMKATRVNYTVFALGAALAFGTAGCDRQTRGNADAQGHSRAASPEEGGATTTTGSAGQAKNFGDTSRSGAHSGVTNPETPKQTATPEANRPENQPQKSTKKEVEEGPR